MAQKRHNVLLIVEGAKEEPRLVNTLFATFNPDTEWKVYPYRTVIYDLIEKIERDYDGDYEDIEICKVLAEMNSDDPDTLHMLLDTTFSDVILLFDFDPHDDRFNPRALRRMMLAFNDSSDTDKGLLLMNYPCVESVKEAVALSYEDFVNSFVKVRDTSNYKRMVSDIKPVDKEDDHENFEHYGSRAFTKAIAHSVGKIQHLVQGIPLEKTFPYTTDSNLSDQCRSVTQAQLLDYQMKTLRVSSSVATCGTGTFFIAIWAKSLDGAWKSCFGE